MIRYRTKPLLTLHSLLIAACATALMAGGDLFRLQVLNWFAWVLFTWLVLSVLLRLVGLTITFGGVVFSGITAFVMMAAHTWQLNLLFFALGLMLAALVLSGLVSFFMLRRIEVRRIAEGSAVAGLPATVHYALANRKRRWPTFAVQICEANHTGALVNAPDGYVLQVSAGSTQTIMTQMVAGRRGTIKLNDIVLSCSFPFGFLLHTIHVSSPRDIVVYPRVGMLSTRLAMLYREAITGGAMTSSLRGGGDEFYGLREYRPGDSVRMISWKRTAHTGQIVVREMTSNAPPQMMVVLDIRRWRELPEAVGGELVEKAIELAASLLCYGSMENFAIGLTIAGAPDGITPTTYTGREARSRMLAALAAIDPREIKPDAPVAATSRIARRPQWIIVTLRGTDPIDDLTPTGASRSVMAMDDPEAQTWLRFVGGLEALRLLRAGGAAISERREPVAPVRPVRTT